MKPTTEHRVDPALAFLRVGDVVQIDGGPVIVEMVNDSRARCLPMATKTVKLRACAALGGEEVEFKAGSGKTVSIATSVARHLLLERTGERGLKDFMEKRKKKTNSNDVALCPGQMVRWEGRNVCVAAVLDGESVAAFDGGVGAAAGPVAGAWTTYRLPAAVDSYFVPEGWTGVAEAALAESLRLRLAECGATAEQVVAQAQAQEKLTFPDANKSRRDGASGSGETQPEQDGDNTMAKKAKTKKAAAKAGAKTEGGWMGYAVTAVLRGLGKAGVSVAHARAIVKAAKVGAADATVAIQVADGAGKGKRGEPAPLTKAQVDELRALAADPKAVESKG